MREISKEYSYKIRALILIVLLVVDYAHADTFNVTLRCPLRYSNIEQDQNYGKLWIEAVKKYVNLYACMFTADNMCIGRSLLLYSTLTAAGHKADLKGLKIGFNKVLHIFVRTEKWGDIDLFPEGRGIGIFTEVPINIKEYSTAQEMSAYNNVAKNILGVVALKMNEIKACNPSAKCL